MHYLRSYPSYAHQNSDETRLFNPECLCHKY